MLENKTPKNELLFFTNDLSICLNSSPAHRGSLLKNLIDRIILSDFPENYLLEILQQCVESKSSDSLDLGIDLISQFGDKLFLLCQSFIEKNLGYWQEFYLENGYSITLFQEEFDQVCVLLRSIARSNILSDKKLTIINAFIGNSSPKDVQESAATALEDFKELEKDKTTRIQ